MVNSAVVFKKNYFFPVLKSPTQIGFIGVKKIGRKSHTWATLKSPLILFRDIMSPFRENPGDLENGERTFGPL
jgi:hypothetical protein